MLENRTRVIVIRNGVAREIEHLPLNVVKILEEAYEQQKVVGIGKDTYHGMTELLQVKVRDYYSILEEMDSADIYQRTVAFCQAFDICSDNASIMFDTLLWIDRAEQEREYFSSRSVSGKTIKNVIDYPYSQVVKEFKNWARGLFKSVGLRVGFIKFCKFYYSVITCNCPSVVME